MSKLGVVHNKKWDHETGGYVQQDPAYNDYVEIYIIQAYANGDTEFMAFRSFETYNEDLLARASGVIEAADDYINSEYGGGGKTAEEADAEEMETCSGCPLGDMIRGLVVAKRMLAEKNGEVAAEAANDFMHMLLEADENIGFYKAYLYTN